MLGRLMGRGAAEVDHRLLRLLALLAAPAVLIVVFAIPLTSGPFGVQLGTLIAIYSLAAVGVDAVVGRGGLLHIGYGLIFGFGAYTVGVTAQHWGGPTIVPLLGGAVLAAAMSLLLGMLLSRSSGYVFAVLTLAAAAAVASIVTNTPWLGGTAGLGGISRDLLGGGEVGEITLYLVICVIAAIAIFLYQRFRYTSTGRAMEAARLVPSVAEASGIDIAALRRRTAILSGLIGGLAGGFFAVLQQYVSAEIVGVTTSVNLLAMNIIGGSTVALSGIPGAYVVVGLPQQFQGLVSYQLILVGAVMLLVAIGFRRGIAGTVGDLWLGIVRPLWAVPRAELESDEKSTDASIAMIELAGRTNQVALDPDGPPTLLADDVTVEFGGLVALRDVSLALRQGEIHALVGPNGAGKSTLVGVIAGQVATAKGRVELAGEDLSALRPDQRTAAGITRTFQLVSLCDTLTVMENVMLGGHPSARHSFTGDFLGIRRQAADRGIQARAKSLLGTLDIIHLADRKPDELTSGHQRLVEIARCLMTDSKVILLDEPAAGLSTTERTHLAQVITGLAANGHAILLIEHDMEFVMSIADRMTVLSRGEVLAAGEPEVVCTEPVVIEAYWGKAAA